jgi:hypothetical protein
MPVFCIVDHLHTKPLLFKDGIVSAEESSLTFHCLPLPKVSMLVIGIGQENWGLT